MIVIIELGRLFPALRCCSVVLHGFCQGDGFRVGFGTCAGKLLPAATEVGQWQHGVVLIGASLE